MIVKLECGSSELCFLLIAIWLGHDIASGPILVSGHPADLGIIWDLCYNILTYMLCSGVLSWLNSEELPHMLHNYSNYENG